MARALHLAAALDGTGWHPASWRLPTARPRDVLTAGYWTDLVREAEQGLLDLVTIEDSFALASTRYGAPDGRTDRLRGRLDAVLVASRLGPVTRHVGLVPSVTVTHTEPFHTSKAIATLDWTSRGRAGVRVQVSAKAHEAALVGRRTLPVTDAADITDPALQPAIDDLFAEAADYVEVVRRLWDSWEDDAEIRDVTTGRFVDVDKLHYIDFEGRWFRVKGPSITPRPPQGQPIVTVLTHGGEPATTLAGTSSDLALVTPSDAADVAGRAAQVRSAVEAAGRDPQHVHVFADVAVLLADSDSAAAARLDELDSLAGTSWRGEDTLLFTGTADGLADLLIDGQAAGITGARLRPAVLPDDLQAISRSLVPALQRRGAFRGGYEADTLRGLLGLPRPGDRYARPSLQSPPAQPARVAGA